LVSVTVVHPSTTLADAWATALLVVGAEQAMDIAEKQRLAVYLVSRRQGEFVVFSTSAFEPYLATNVGDV
jgi:thiamine biosynthesis lipoprotein